MEGNTIRDNDLKRSIILDNYSNPRHKGVPDDTEGYIKINSNNSRISKT